MDTRGLDALGSITRRLLCMCFLVGTLGGITHADGSVSGGPGSAADAEEDAVANEFVGLSPNPAVLDALQRHVALSEEFQTRPDAANACNLARSAQELVPPLAASLGGEHASLLSSGGDGDGDDASALDAFEHRVDIADKRLAGLGLRVGAEAMYVFVRYGEIADAAVDGSDEAMLFRAVARLWDSATGWPVYIERQTDVTGCHHPGALIEPLQDLARVWRRAPECARSAVLDAVRASVRDAVSEASCYCGTRETTTADVSRLSALADELGVGASAPAVEAVWTHLRRNAVQFECVAQ